MPRQSRPIRNVIGSNLKRIRKSRGLTQAALAIRLHNAGWEISKKTVAAIESGSRRTVDRELILLADILEAKVSEFFPPFEEVRQLVSSPAFKRN